MNKKVKKVLKWPCHTSVDCTCVHYDVHSIYFKWILLADGMERYFKVSKNLWGWQILRHCLHLEEISSGTWIYYKVYDLLVIFSNVIALALAVMLTKKFKGANFLRGCIFYSIYS